MYRWEQVPRYGLWLLSPRWLIPKVALPQRRKRQAGRKAAGGLSKQGRAVVARKGSKASGLGEDVSDSGSAGTVEHRARQTKSEVTKREAN